MNRDQLLILVLAVGAVVGVAVAASGFDAASRPASESDIRSLAKRRDTRMLPPVVGGLATCAIFALSGWVIPALVVGAIGWWLVGTVGRRDQRDRTGIAKLDALASWVENVRDVLQSGNQPIGAIGATTETCSPLVGEHVRRLYARLSAGQSADVAFRRFADEIDDPLADLIAVGLLIAVSRGSETEDVLSTLAAQARQMADRRRIVEAERAPARREVLMVSAIMCALLLGLFFGARSSYLDAYDDTGGQLFLGAILGGYGALLAWVGRLARYPRPARFLTMGSAMRSPRP